MVDIITENGDVIGQVPKDEAHKKGLLHCCVVAEVIDSQGNWTLVKQAADRQDAGQFVSPVGGHISAGENEETALKREALEEMGLTDFRFKRIGQAIFNREVIGRKENHLFVLFEIYTDQKPTLNHESVAFEKFSREELQQQLRQNPTKFGDAFWFAVRKLYPELEPSTEND